MNKIFHSAFDFFTHAIPGFCIVAAVVILNSDLVTMDDFINRAGQIKLGGGIFLFVISYITGFAIHPVGRFLYRKIGFLIWKEKILNDVEIFISDKYIMTREFSPANFKYIETWNMFCAMAHNLAAASLIFFLVCIIKFIFADISNYGFWIFLTVVSLVSFFIFLHRAVRFSIWAAHDLNASISRLNLIEKAKNY